MDTMTYGDKPGLPAVWIAGIQMIPLQVADGMCNDAAAAAAKAGPAGSSRPGGRV